MGPRNAFRCVKVWACWVAARSFLYVILQCTCRVTNPHDFEVDGVAFLGTSGQNIEDIDRYSTDEDRLEMLEHVLQWGHLAPTAPDTLTAYSFSDKDPFVIESAPHVLFAGNQPAFASKLLEGTNKSSAHCKVDPLRDDPGHLLCMHSHAVSCERCGRGCFCDCADLQCPACAGREGQKVRLLCVPRFSSTGILVLVNLRTLNVQPITFDARLDSSK